MASAGFVGSRGSLGFGVTFTLDDQFSNRVPSIQNAFNSIGHAVDNMVDRVHEGFRSVLAGVFMITEAIELMNPFRKALDESIAFEALNARMTTLMGSAELAGDAIQRLTDDALTGKNLFDLKDIIDANAGLVAIGKTADEAHDAVLGVAGVIEAMGGSNSNMRMAIADLQKIAEVGYADRRHIFSLSYSAKIPIMPLLEDSLKKSGPELDAMIKDRAITFDMLSEAMFKATQEGGRFAGAIGRLYQTTKGQELLEANLQMVALKNIGDAIKPVYHDLLLIFNELLQKFITFSQTAEGQFIIKMVAGATAVIALTLAFGGLLAILYSIGPAIMAALSPLWPFIAVIALLTYNLYDMAGSYENFITLLKGLGAAFMSANDGGFSLSEDLAKALQDAGLLDFVVKLGTWFVRIKAFFGGLMDGVEAFIDALASVYDTFATIFNFFGIGIGKTTSDVNNFRKAGEALADLLGTYLIISSFKAIQSFGSMVFAIQPLKGIITSLGLVFQEVMPTIIYWVGLTARWIAQMIAEVVVPAIMSFWSTIQFAVYGALTALWEFVSALAIAAYEMAASWLIAMGPIGWIILGVIALGAIIWYFSDEVGAAMSAAWDWVAAFFMKWWDYIQVIGTWLSDLAGKAYDAGVNFVNSLLNGIMSAWDSLMSWLSDAWNGSILGEMFNWILNIDGGASSGTMGGGGGTFAAAGDISTGGAMPVASSLDDMAYNKADQNYNNSSTVIDKTVTDVQNIHVALNIDSDELSTVVLDKAAMELARG